MDTKFRRINCTFSVKLPISENLITNMQLQFRTCQTHLTSYIIHIEGKLRITFYEVLLYIFAACFPISLHTNHFTIKIAENVLSNCLV